MNNQELDQLTVKALNTVYLMSRGMDDPFFPQMRAIIQIAYLEGERAVLQKQLDEITNLKQK